jgi:hypothetical protein
VPRFPVVRMRDALRVRPAILALVVCAGMPAAAGAQHEHHPPAPRSGWGWSVESNAFLNATWHLYARWNVTMTR